jgi:hypothetical protein
MAGRERCQSGELVNEPGFWSAPTRAQVVTSHGLEAVTKAVGVADPIGNVIH